MKDVVGIAGRVVVRRWTGSKNSRARLNVEKDGSKKERIHKTKTFGARERRRSFLGSRFVGKRRSNKHLGEQCNRPRCSLLRLVVQVLVSCLLFRCQCSGEQGSKGTKTKRDEKRVEESNVGSKKGEKNSNTKMNLVVVMFFFLVMSRKRRRVDEERGEEGRGRRKQTKTYSCDRDEKEREEGRERKKEVKRKRKEREEKERRWRGDERKRKERKTKNWRRHEKRMGREGAEEGRPKKKKE